MNNTTEHTHGHTHNHCLHGGDENPLEIAPHNHRAIIGFDKNGVPKVLLPVSGEAHTHVVLREIHTPILMMAILQKII